MSAIYHLPCLKSLRLILPDFCVWLKTGLKALLHTAMDPVAETFCLKLYHALDIKTSLQHAERLKKLSGLSNPAEFTV